MSENKNKIFQPRLTLQTHEKVKKIAEAMGVRSLSNVTEILVNEAIKMRMEGVEAK